MYFLSKTDELNSNETKIKNPVSKNSEKRIYLVYFELKYRINMTSIALMLNG